MSCDPLTGEPIKFCQSMAVHCKYVWFKFIKQGCKAKEIAILAHSAGGYCTAVLFKAFREEFLTRVKCLVFTDALYHSMLDGLTPTELEHLKRIAIHFKAYRSTKTLTEIGKVLNYQNGEILEVSAGTSVHAYTTGVPR